MRHLAQRSIQPKAPSQAEVNYGGGSRTVAPRSKVGER
jgi:hypothetical protein